LTPLRAPIPPDSTPFLFQSGLSARAADPSARTLIFSQYFPIQRPNSLINGGPFDREVQRVAAGFLPPTINVPLFSFRKLRIPFSPPDDKLSALRTDLHPACGAPPEVKPFFAVCSMEANASHPTADFSPPPSFFAHRTPSPS